jgi:hypothetical protein
MASRNLVRKHRISRAIIVVISIVTVCLSGQSFAWFSQSGPVPQITSQTALYDPDGGRLIIKGRNFQKGATVILNNAQGPITFTSAKIKNSKKIIFNEVPRTDITDGVDVSITNPDGVTSGMVHIAVEILADESKLTANDVRTIISQAVAQADASGLKVTIAVTDKEGSVLGVFKMAGSRNDITIGIGLRARGYSPRSACRA